MAHTNYVTAIAAFAERDFRKNNRFLNMLMNSAKSMQYNALFNGAHPNGGSAYDARVSLLVGDDLTALLSDGYQTAGSYPDSDLDPTSVTYTKPTEQTLTPKVDRIALAKFQLAIEDLNDNPLNSQWVLECAAASEQKISNQIETMLLSEILARGQVEAGPSTQFALRTDSASNFASDVKDIIAGARLQDGGNYSDWVICLPVQYEGNISQFAPVSSLDYQDRAQGNVADARVYRHSGFNWMFSPSFSAATEGVAVNLDKIAFLNPKGMKARQLTDTGTPLSDFYVMWKRWGIAFLGKDIGSAKDGVATTGIDREGVLAISVS